MADVHEDDVDDFVFRLSVGSDDEVVITGVIAGGLGVFVHIVLAHFVHLLDDLTGLLRRFVLLAGDAVYAEVHRGLDEDAQAVGMIAEYKETASACNYARSIAGDTLQDLLLCLEHFIGSEQVGFIDGVCLIVVSVILIADGHRALEISPPGMTATLEFLNLLNIEFLHFLQGLDKGLVVERDF